MSENTKPCPASPAESWGDGYQSQAGEQEFRKKDAENAAQYPGSVETGAQGPAAEYPFICHDLACPLSNFARQYGNEEYMRHLCSLDYVMFGIPGAPLYRSHTCYMDGDHCDFTLKPGAPIMEYWPPVYVQKKGFQ